MASKQVLIIGSNGREHALGWKLKQSSRVNKIYFAPGTIGTEKIGESTGINKTDVQSLVQFALSKNIDLTVVGPDDSLAVGIVDAFRKKKLTIFGPTLKADQIESSKAFAKKFMNDEKIETSEYEIFSDFLKAKKYIINKKFPIVIKASGLALGKGVTIAKTFKEAEKALKDIMVKKIFGSSGDRVIIENFLEGKEVSVHAFSDGRTFSLFPISCDHKTIFEDNKGLNTGGMGTVAPIKISDKNLKIIKEKIVAPAIFGMNERKIPFTGCLYPGVMITKNGIKVLEFNARFGDPETESYMRLLKSDLYDILLACSNGYLSDLKIEWSKEYACCIVLASKEYPGSFKKNEIIYGLEKFSKSRNIVVFHFATEKIGDKIFTNGGRVLGITAVGKTLKEALKRAYACIGKQGIYFQGMQYRKDIGKYV